MLVVGPEDPLVKGIRNYFSEKESLEHIMVAGPSREGALLEGSKDFAKLFMQKHNIPTAAFRSFKRETFEPAVAFLKQLPPPYVLKADGLAAGKGVLILDNMEEAIAELSNMFEGKFGSAGHTVVIETFLDGIEVSVFVLTDGRDYKILPEAKDYKRIGEGNTGLNTGGMGCISPVPFADAGFMEKVESRIIKPTINGFRKDGIDFRGFIFFGLMNVGGDPFLMEYNVRMGDPEAEVVIPRIKTDLLEMLIAVCKQDLSGYSLEIDSRSAATVMLVSGGYPGNYEKGKPIRGLDDVRDSIIFHAGTIAKGNSILTNGGRVLAVSSFGKNMQEALDISYKNARHIQFEKIYYRKDLGFDLK